MEETATCSVCNHVHQNADGSCGCDTDNGACECKEGVTPTV